MNENLFEHFNCCINKYQHHHHHSRFSVQPTLGNLFTRKTFLYRKNMFFCSCYRWYTFTASLKWMRKGTFMFFIRYVLCIHDNKRRHSLNIWFNWAFVAGESMWVRLRLRVYVMYTYIKYIWNLENDCWYLNFVENFFILLVFRFEWVFFIVLSCVE